MTVLSRMLSSRGRTAVETTLGATAMTLSERSLLASLFHRHPWVHGVDEGTDAVGVFVERESPGTGGRSVRRLTTAGRAKIAGIRYRRSRAIPNRRVLAPWPCKAARCEQDGAIADGPKPCSPLSVTGRSSRSTSPVPGRCGITVVVSTRGCRPPCADASSMSGCSCHFIGSEALGGRPCDRAPLRRSGVGPVASDSCGDRCVAAQSA